MLTSFALFIRIFSTKLTNPFPGFCLTQSGTCNSLTCNFCGLEFVLVKKSIQMLILKQAYIIVILLKKNWFAIHGLSINTVYIYRGLFPDVIFFTFVLILLRSLQNLEKKTDPITLEL